MTDRLFVYGTLLANYEHEMSKFLNYYTRATQDAYYYGKLYDVGSYPASIESNNPYDRVYGTLITFINPEFVLNMLDEYEGVDERLYERKYVKVYTKDGKSMGSWIYLFLKDVSELKRIHSGNYLKYIL